MDCGFYQTFMGGRSTATATPTSSRSERLQGHALPRIDGRRGQLANPMGNAVKDSYALAVAAGGADDYVPMLATAVARRNGLKPE